MEEKSSKLNDANEKIRRLTEDSKKLKDRTIELETQNKGHQNEITTLKTKTIADLESNKKELERKINE